MAQAFGNTLGPLYPLGIIAPSVPGTAVPLNQNVTTDTSFGTAKSPAPIVATKLIFSPVSGNTGLVYVCMKSGSKNIPTSVLFTLIPNFSPFILESPQLSNPFQLNNLVIDADVTSNGVYITAVIV